MTTSYERRITNIIDRLIVHFDEKERIKKRSQEILKLTKEQISDDSLITAYSKLSQKKDSSQQTIQEFENTAVAYLLQKLQEIPQSSSFEIREEQIQAIVVLLEKGHLQAKTGFGKSSIIIPIASLVGCLSENGQYAVATVSPELKAELYQRIIEISQLLPEKLQPDIYQFQKQREEDFSKPDQGVFAQMAKKLIEEPGFDQSLPEQRKKFFQSLFGVGHYFVSSKNQPADAIDKEKPALCLFEENDYVFYTVQQNDQFSHTVFDEIHVPRSRNSFYYLSIPSFYHSPEKVGEYLLKRFLASYFRFIIEENNLFTEREGGFWFKDDEAEKIFFEQAVFKDQKNSQYFNAAVSFIAQKIGLDQEKFANWLKQFSLKNYEDLVHEVLLSLSRAKAIREGVHYKKEGEKQIVRDRFMGLALSSHRFSPSIQLGLQAWDDVLDFIDYYEGATKTVSFEGWVANILQGKISGLSNNLFTPLLTNPDQLRKTPLAEFLEKYTGRPAIFIGEEQKIQPPTPMIFKSYKKMLDELTNLLTTDPRLTIVYCLDENEALRLEQLIRQSLPQREVIVANALISEDETKRRYQQFANSQNAILISTGRVGVGVDFKDSQGNFTDHKSIIFGLPLAVDQIYQFFGRRRLKSKKPEDDFLWLISHHQIKDSDAFLSLEEDERKKILESLEKNPMKTIERLITISENLSRQSDRFLIEFDELYETTFQRFQEKTKQYLRHQLQSQQLSLLEDLSPEDRKILNLFSEQVFSKSLSAFFQDFVAVPPADLYWRLRDTIYFSNSPYLPAYVTKIVNSVLSDDNIAEWFEIRKEQFEQLLTQVVLAQIKQSCFYDQFKQKAPCFYPCAFYPAEILANINVGDISSLEQEKVITLQNGLVGFRRDNNLYILVNSKTGEPIILNEGQGLDWIITLKNGFRIAVVFS